VTPVQPELAFRPEGNRPWPVLTWKPPAGWRSIASGVVGGGLGPCEWWLNAMVAKEYHRPDPDRHVLGIAAGLGLPADRPGVGMLTAADVTARTSGTDGGVVAWATVGLGWPVWAAGTDEQAPAEHHLRQPAPPGTINLLVVVPVPLSDAALVNAVVTATEAKTQALVEAGVDGSGTSSDAIALACPAPSAGDPGEPYGGPRSVWGSRLARAVHRSVATGTAQWLARNAGMPGSARWGGMPGSARSVGPGR
jgi:adenosylcobinamide hydrolase